jgi:hypothetical protein
MMRVISRVGSDSCVLVRDSGIANKFSDRAVPRRSDNSAKVGRSEAASRTTLSTTIDHSSQQQINEDHIDMVVTLPLGGRGTCAQVRPSK